MSGETRFPAPGKAAFLLGALLLSGAALHARGIEEFNDNGLGLWAAEPERVGARPAWQVVVRDGERAARNTPSTGLGETSWRLVRQYDLSGAPSAALELGIDFLGLGYDGLTVRAAPLGDPLETLARIDQATAGRRELQIDLSHLAGGEVTVELELTKPAGRVEPSVGLYLFRVGIELPEAASVLQDEITDFHRGFEAWVPSPEKMGRGGPAGWTVRTEGERSFARANPTASPRAYTWRLRREIDLSPPVQAATLELSYRFRGGDYERFEVGVGERDATAASDFVRILAEDQATGDSARTVALDLSPFLGRAVIVQLSLRKRGAAIAADSGLEIERVGVSFEKSRRFQTVEHQPSEFFFGAADLARGAELVVRGTVVGRSAPFPVHGTRVPGGPRVLNSPPLILRRAELRVAEVLKGDAARAGETIAVLQETDEVEGRPVASGVMPLENGREVIVFLHPAGLSAPAGERPDWFVAGIDRGIYLVDRSTDPSLPDRATPARNRYGDPALGLSLLRQSFEALAAQGVAAESLALLQSLQDQPFAAESRLLAAVEERVGPEAARKLGPALLPAAYRIPVGPLPVLDLERLQEEVRAVAKETPEERKEP